MIRLGLRLSLNGGKEAAIRLAVTAAAVALGVGMLLITLAGINALNAQNARAAWLNTSPPGRLASRLPPGSRSAFPGAGTSAPDALASGGRPVTIVGRRRDRLDQVAAPFAPLIDVVAADVATVAGARAVASVLRSSRRACAGVVAAAGGLSPPPARAWKESAGTGRPRLSPTC